LAQARSADIFDAHQVKPRPLSSSRKPGSAASMARRVHHPTIQIDITRNQRSGTPERLKSRLPTLGDFSLFVVFIFGLFGPNE
jgi:hypothetical protein